MKWIRIFLFLALSFSTLTQYSQANTAEYFGTVDRTVEHEKDAVQEITLHSEDKAPLSEKQKSILLFLSFFFLGGSLISFFFVKDQDYRFLLSLLLLFSTQIILFSLYNHSSVWSIAWSIVPLAIMIFLSFSNSSRFRNSYAYASFLFVFCFYGIIYL